MDLNPTMIILTPRLLWTYHLLAVAVSIISASPIPQGNSLHNSVPDTVTRDNLVHRSVLDRGEDEDDPLPQVDHENVNGAGRSKQNGDEDTKASPKGGGSSSQLGADQDPNKRIEKQNIRDFLLAITAHPENDRNWRELQSDFKNGGKWNFNRMHEEAGRLNIDSTKLPPPTPVKSKAPVQVKDSTRTSTARRKIYRAIRDDFIEKALKRMREEDPSMTMEKVVERFRKEKAIRWDDEKIKRYAKENSITLLGPLQ
ncbi:hypothetical protein H0H93_001186 [Arthromyces matolae]|nr:hypothetical protein H0H93_001186 [Arthromyces matolae]